MSVLKKIAWLVPAIAWASILYWFSATPNLAISAGPSDYLLRKTAHILAYGLLLVLLYVGLARTLSVRWSTTLVAKAAAIAIAYAIFDELHQSTVPTRNGNVLDVVINSLGVALGVGIVGWFEWWGRVTNVPDTNPRSSFNYMGQSVSVKQLPALVAKLVEIVEPGQVIALQGDLGAGKTTFTKQFLKALGVTKTVTSPTYTIERQYTATNFKVYHHDWYRLANDEEVALLDIEGKMATADAIMVVEWPERAPHLLPDGAIWITFEYVDQQTRKITINR